MINRYIYKLYFRNGCTYVGKHTEKRPNDGYVTSSSYYKKHIDLFEKREILLDNIKDDDTLDIMETICIFADICENKYNVNYNYGAWMNDAKFDRGFRGPANGMYGKKQSSEAKLKMHKAWTDERKKKQHIRMAGTKRPQNINMNKSKEHIEKCRQGHERYMRSFCFRYIKNPDIVVDYDAYKQEKYPSNMFKKEKYTDQKVMTLEEWTQYKADNLYVANGRTYIYGPASKGKHWFNNNITEVYAVECPEGFKKGRLPRSKEARANSSAAMKRRYLNGWEHPLKGKPAWNRGKPMSEEQKNKLRRKIINVETGIIYNGLKELLRLENISMYRYCKDKKDGKYKAAGN